MGFVFVNMFSSFRNFVTRLNSAVCGADPPWADSHKACVLHRTTLSKYPIL